MEMLLLLTKDSCSKVNIWSVFNLPHGQLLHQLEAGEFYHCCGLNPECSTKDPSAGVTLCVGVCVKLSCTQVVLLCNVFSPLWTASPQTQVSGASSSWAGSPKTMSQSNIFYFIN